MSTRTASEKGPISIEAVPEVETDTTDSWRRSDPAMLGPQLAPVREQPELRANRSHRIIGSGRIRRIIGWVAGSLMVAAIIASALLLLSDVGARLAAFFKM